MSQGESTCIVVPEQLFEQEQADELRRSIEYARLSGAKKIELNFENCRATSAYALNILSQAQEQLKVAGGTLTICSLKPEMKEILSSILFDLLVPIQDGVSR